MDQQSPMSPYLEAYSNEVIKKFIPGGMSIKWKSKNSIMKAITPIAKVFNKDFENYITTVFNTVYVPDNWNEKDEETKITILAHEMVHVIDQKRNPLFSFLYFVPQVLFPILAIILALCFWSPWPLLVALLGLLPLPAPWRFYYELRGYRMEVLIVREVFGDDPDDFKRMFDSFINELTGPNYYFTMPFKTYVQNKMSEKGWEGEDLYVKTIDFLKSHPISK